MFSIKQYLDRKCMENRIKKIDAMEETEITRMCIEDYLGRAAMYEFSGNADLYGGMIRGATIHMKNLRNEIIKLKEIGVNTDRVEKSLSLYKESINDDITITNIMRSPYLEELLNEGWFYEYNEK